MNKIKDSRYGPIIFPDKDKYVGRSFDLYGEFSYHEVDFLKELIEPGNVVIDVGANIGGITIPLAQKLGPSGYMIAFEPQQYMYYVLCGNIAINNLINTACFLRLVGDTDGEVKPVPTFDYEKEANFGNNFSRESENALPVATCTIDSLNLSHLNLLKIDVEGSELEVLLGAGKTIQRTRPFVYVEAEKEDKATEIIEFLEKFDYKCIFHRPPLFNPNNFNGEKEDVFDTIVDGKIVNLIVSGNIFAYPKEKTEWNCTVDRKFFQEKYKD